MDRSPAEKAGGELERRVSELLEEDDAVPGTVDEARLPFSKGSGVQRDLFSNDLLPPPRDSSVARERGPTTLPERRPPRRSAVRRERPAASAPVEPVPEISEDRGGRGETRVSTAREVLRRAGFLGVFGGWVLAVVLGHGFDLHRLYWPVVLAGPGALLVLATSGGRLTRLPSAAFLLFGAGTVYFLARALASPVGDLARLDLPLICGFGLAFLVGACAPGKRYVFAAMAVVTLAHLAVGAYQLLADPAFAVFRGERNAGSGVSGLYFHRNYLAGFLGTVLSFGAAFVFGERRKLAWRLAGGVFLILTVVLLVLTFSRAGAAAGLVGGLITFLSLLVLRARRAGVRSRAAHVAGGLIGAALIGVVLLVVVRLVFEARGKGAELASGDLAGSRPTLTGIAFESWMKSPLFGNGSRSFSYLSIADWHSSLGSWLGSPDMVHNEYLQVLTDYGIVGLLLVFAFLGLVAYRALGRIVAGGTEGRDGGPGWLGAALLGALVAAAMQASVDFATHILPNLMILALLMGMTLAATVPAGPDGEAVHPDEGGTGWNWKGVTAVAVLALLVCVWAGSGWREILRAPALWRLEKLDRAEGVSAADYRSALAAVCAQAPTYEFDRQLGAMELERATSTETPDGEIAEAIESAVKALAEAVRRHPFDGESLVNYGSALELAGREGALPVYRRAVAATWGREDRFGAMFHYSLALARRAERCLDARRLPEGMGFLNRSREYLVASRQGRYKGLSATEFQAQLRWLDSVIASLREAGVQPVAPPGDPSPAALEKR